MTKEVAIFILANEIDYLEMMFEYRENSMDFENKFKTTQLIKNFKLIKDFIEKNKNE